MKAETRTKVETLASTRLWRGGSPETLQRAAARARPRRFADGEILIRRDEPGRALHVITTGRVDVRVRADEDEEAVVASLGPGECVGEMSLLTGDPASADVVASGDVETLALAAPELAAIVALDPDLLRQFARILSQRLSRTDATVGEARARQQDLAAFLRDGTEWDEELVGASAEIRALHKRAEELAADEGPILVRGEDGTGRELAAGLLHRRSARRDALVIGVDCGLVSETVWGDPLFGARGAAGSHDRPLCYVELAEGGTLVLRHLEVLPAAVQQRLLHHLDGDEDRHDVRVIATCPPVSTNGTEGVAPELLERFGERVLEVPALRDRKRDIPLLAEHFRKKHAQRLEKPAASFSDQALTRLVSYDYAVANDCELEEAVERAVILTDGDVVEEETIFLGPPPPPRPGGLNLLRLPGLNALRLARVLPKIAQVAAALFFAFILVEAFFGPLLTKSNLATTLVWGLWWPLLVLSFFVAGRAWCAACPMGLATATGDRVRESKRRIPGWLKKHDLEIAMAGLFLIVFVEEATAMRHSPVATGLLLLAILAGAALTGLLFPRRTWCRHICPLGGLAGVCATSGLLEIRPTTDICVARCKGHACFKGDEHVAGCPMFNHVMFVDTNQHCVLCMNCVQSCPNGSPQLNLRLPGRELFSGAAAGAGLGRFVLMLLGLLVGVAWIQHLERAGSTVLSEHRVLVVASVLGAGAGLPFLAFRLLAPDPTRDVWHRVVSFIPLLTAGFVAYQLTYLPGLADLHLSLAAGGGGGLSVPLLALLQILAVAGGWLVTAVLLRRAGGRLGLLAASAGYGALLLGFLLVP